MKFGIKTLFLLFLSVNYLFADNYIDSLTLTKIKKLVQKEEEIALAYKKYLLEKGTNPTTIEVLKEQNFLPKGFDSINPFGKVISFKNNEYVINGFSTTDNTLKSNLYDYYYSNRYRTYTKAPLSINESEVQIILSTKEKFIFNNKSKITTTKEDAKAKYYLDSNEVLHWYDSSGNYKYSFDKDLLLDENVTLLNEDGTVNSTYKELVKDVSFAGMTVLHKNTTSSTADEYIMIGSSSAVKVKQTTRDIGKTVIQFTRRAGGMIVNGDIYTWGNIANRIVGIDKNNYTKGNGVSGSYYPVITGLVRARARIYDVDKYVEQSNTKTNRKECKSPIGTGVISCKYSTVDCNPPSGTGNILCKDIGINYYEENYFSSPNRPKFVDFFSTVFHSTCGISTKGELYCGGLASAYQKGFLYSDVEPSNPSVEMLYKSKDFDGTTDKKATKIFANDGFWLIFGNTDIDSNGNYKNGRIYRWGDTNYGFGGNGSRSYSTTRISELDITDNNTKVLFKDLTYLLTLGHRKIAALSNQGDIYIWGVDSYNSNSFDCTRTWDGVYYNLCIPTKITSSNSTMTSSIKFESIQGGLDSFIAKSEEGNYYKISHPIDEKIKVISVEDSIKNYQEYKVENDSEILSVDFSRKLTDTDKSNPGQGIVWVNGKYELKGDYLSSSISSEEDTTIFKSAIKQIKWKKIKVIQDDNGMCGIDVNDQMYCWGMMSYYGDYMRDTFMLPVFNTNLYDTNKDFLVAEGGNSNLTNMTSNDWTTSDSKKPFFMKYPTYIGGFNYEFIFK